MSDEAKFLHLMLKAEAMCEIDTEKADYWRGYMRGFGVLTTGRNSAPGLSMKSGHAWLLIQMNPGSRWGGGIWTGYQLWGSRG